MNLIKTNTIEIKKSKFFQSSFALILRRVQVLLVKNEKEHAWAINSRNIH